eukprot:1052582-Prorocentrum_minimum.AAC.1
MPPQEDVFRTATSSICGINQSVRWGHSRRTLVIGPTAERPKMRGPDKLGRGPEGFGEAGS